MSADAVKSEQRQALVHPRSKECTNPLASSELLNALLPDIANDGATVAPGIPCILSTRAIIVDSAKRLHC
ncbi:unnamed protein product (mitochondrion) [Plasmodiophora brassicae]|uniref:Uncharacterized protein n=1 Tax=Plasmodiophora brassicae TaxID=37360 RepID=A0A3P3Y8A7_PLABS|nr:unnamed protein product [Plasmodiophora brassicae]